MPDRRTQILRAAHRVFAHRGYHPTGIADIATELGIGHGTVYRYFKNKRDIFSAVIAELFTRLVAVTEADAGPSAESLSQYREKVERVGGAMIQLFAADPEAVDLLFRHARGVDAELTAQMTVAIDALSVPIERDLAHGIQCGYLRSDLDVTLTARALRAMVLEAIEHSAHTDDPQATGAAWLQTIVGITFESLAAAPH